MAHQPVILITGASSGIGAATARRFARQGYRVVLAARRAEKLESLAVEIQAGGGQALAVTTDLARLADIQNMVQATLDGFGQVDILFNNAGFGRLDWLECLDPEQDIQSQVQVDLLGVILATRATLPHMIARRSGHVINMVSLAGLVGTPTYTIYSASKFGVRGFTEALRREVRVYNIQVSAIYPGGVRTEFIEHTGVRRKTGATTPAALKLEAEQVAEAVWKTVNRPRRTVVLPWPMMFAVWLNTLFPGLIDRVIEHRFTRPERQE